MSLSAPDRRRSRVLVVAYVVAPRRAATLVVDDEHRDVRHEASWCGAMPVLLARLEEHTVPRADHLDRATATLREADAFGDEDGLTVWMRVPRRAGPRREVDAARAQARWIGRPRNRVDIHRSGEPLARPCHGADAVPRDLHLTTPHLWQASSKSSPANHFSHDHLACTERTQ